MVNPSPQQPLFWTVTGLDFGRSIAWAKKQPRLRDLLAAANRPVQIPPPYDTEICGIPVRVLPPEAFPPGVAGYMVGADGKAVVLTNVAGS